MVENAASDGFICIKCINCNVKSTLKNVVAHIPHSAFYTSFRKNFPHQYSAFYTLAYSAIPHFSPTQHCRLLPVHSECRSMAKSMMPEVFNDWEAN